MRWLLYLPVSIGAGRAGSVLNAGIGSKSGRSSDRIFHPDARAGRDDSAPGVLRLLESEKVNWSCPAVEATDARQRKE